MREPFIFRFAWTPEKARRNHAKHQVSFELASTVFRDPLAMSLFDAGHSEREARWVTLGQDEHLSLLVVVHTFEELSVDEVAVRIISARKATRRERAQYESGQGAIGEPMKDEYDFTNAVRGRFFRKEAALDVPVYLEAGVRDFLSTRAKARGIEVSDLVNELLKEDVEQLKAAK